MPPEQGEIPRVADADEFTLREGDRIEDYVIEKVLGAGSFGVTYLARDEHLNRGVAIKEYMPVQYARRDSTGKISSRSVETAGTFEWGLDRFSEEARTLAQFNHPNIVRVMRIVQGHNGTSYIVMELLGGTNMEDHIEANGALETPAFLSNFRQIVEGMQAVHGLGILHRDIKPANIVLEERGPVLIDFGAARDLAMQQKAGFSALVTDGYSPPEQYSSKNTQSEASDIYALAATAHYMLSGEIPPPAAARHAGEDLDPASVVRPDLPEDVAKAIDRGLELKMVDRPQSIAAWLEEMPSLTADPEVEREVVFVERGSKLPIDRRALLLLGGGLVVAGGAAAVLLGRDSSVSSSSAPLAHDWTHTVAPLYDDPYPAIALGESAVLLAAYRYSPEGDRLLLARYSLGGEPDGTYEHSELASRGHAALAMPDGGAIVAGENQGGALVIRLDKQLQPMWTQQLEPASISTLLRLGNRVVAGLEGPASSGQAKLLFLNEDNGALDSRIPLLDRQGDSIQQVAPLADGNIAVLGSRLEERLVGGQQMNVASLWLSKVTPEGEELWRQTESGLGYANPIDLIEAGEEIFVSGKTSPDDNAANYRTLVMRVSKGGQKVWTRHDYDEGPSTGRGFAKGTGGTPALYMAGWVGSPPRARIAQLGPDGDFVWSQVSEDTAGFGNVAANMAIAPDGSVYVVGMAVPTSDTLELTLARYT